MSWLFIYLLKVSIILAIAFSIYCLAFRKSTLHQCNRFYLLASLVLSFLAPPFTFELQTQDTLYHYVLPTIEMSQLSVAPVASGIALPGWSTLLAVLYFAIGLIVLVRLLVSIRGLVLSWQGMDQELSEGAVILTSDKDEVAYSFLNTIVLPADLKQNRERYDLILQHEQLHVRHKHSLDVLFVALCKVVLWFNPIIYFLKKELAAQHEYFIDRKMTESEERLETYGQLLINQSLRGHHHALFNAFNNSLTKNRITMMTKVSNRRSSVLKYIFFTPLLLTLVFLGACTKAPEVLEDEVASLTFKSKDGRDFLYPDELPAFEGGSLAMMEYIGANINYPPEARDGKVEGKVCLDFIVEADGSVSNVDIETDIGGGCGKEALRVVQSMPNWKPGTKDGKPIPVKYKLPIMFRME